MKIVLTTSLAAALLAAAPAGAQPPPQTQPPGRLDNIWNGKSHEMAPDAIRQSEQAAGLRGDAAQRRARDEEVNSLDKQILQRAQQGGKDGVMNGTAATAPGQ